jgi:metallo-beta-lactamase family protein
MAQQATALYRRHAKLLRVPAREMKNLVDGRAHGHHAAAVDAAVAFALALRDHLGQRHGHRRPRAAPPEGHGARPAPPHRVSRLPGRRQPRGAPGGRATRGEDPRRDTCRCAPEVSHLEGFSGHADADELLDWLAAFRSPPRRPSWCTASPTPATRCARIQQRFGWRVQVAGYGEAVTA